MVDKELRSTSSVNKGKFRQAQGDLDDFKLKRKLDTRARVSTIGIISFVQDG